MMFVGITMLVISIYTIFKKKYFYWQITSDLKNYVSFVNKNNNNNNNK